MLGQFGGAKAIEGQPTTNHIDQLKNLGLCNLAIQNLFYQMLQKQDDFSYSVSVSYLEIYNENVRDLLFDLKDFKQKESEMSLRDLITQISN